MTPHQHTFNESCPGNGFPTRADLVAQTLAYKARKRADTVREQGVVPYDEGADTV